MTEVKWTPDDAAQVEHEADEQLTLIDAQPMNMWVQLSNFNNAPAQASELFPKDRQTALVLMYNPDLKSFAMHMNEASIEDGRGNLNPPQGEIRTTETLFAAAVREAGHETGIIFSENDLTYLGSMKKEAPTGRKSEKFEAQNFHVCLLTTKETYLQSPKKDIFSLDWVRGDHLGTCVYPQMSQAKLDVVTAAIREAVALQDSPVPYYVAA